MRTNRITPQLVIVLETGRHYGLDLAGITQQPNLIHNRIRNQASWLSRVRALAAGGLPPGFNTLGLWARSTSGGTPGRTWMTA